MTYKDSPNALSVTGVKKTHGRKAVKWLVKRCLAAWYDERTGELKAFEWKYGREWSYSKLYEALEATR